MGTSDSWRISRHTSIPFSPVSLRSRSTTDGFRSRTARRADGPSWTADTAKPSVSRTNRSDSTSGSSSSTISTSAGRRSLTVGQPSESHLVELDSFAREEEDELLADVHYLIPHALQGPRDHHRLGRPLQAPGIVTGSDDLLVHVPVEAVDGFVHRRQEASLVGIAADHGFDAGANHRSHQVAHLLDALDDRFHSREAVAGVGQLGDVDGLVAHAL